jgi:serine/threonine-protein kinase
MRAAARALALDPEARESAELVGKLMMEPPAEAPREVEAELDAIAVDALRAHSVLGSRAMTACLMFFPVLYWAGFREAWFLVAGPVLAATIVMFTWVFARRPVAWLVPATIGASALLIAVLSRVVTPFFVAPALGVVVGMLYAMHVTSGRAWVLWSVMILAILGPFVLEISGVVSSTTFVIDDEVVLRIGAANLDGRIGLAAMAVFIAVMLAISIAMSRSQAHNQRAAQRMVQIQAWNLRQLVPAGSDTSARTVMATYGT